MSAGIYDFIMDQGSTFNLEVLYRDTNDAIIDLTGYTAAMQIRKSYDTPVILNLTTENGGITITGNLGKIDIQASATQTGAILNGEYVYDLEITLGTTVQRVIQGTVNVTPEVTRA
jgi:hypothetical protein